MFKFQTEGLTSLVPPRRGNDSAHTAYGALASVPPVDLLIAGTSCVDYSNLNKAPKGIDDGGESGKTFHGMLSYVKKHKPALVILENVSGCPWAKVVEHFKSIDYAAHFLRVDSKNYYVPHTRTRGYLLAMPKGTNSKASTQVKNWAVVLEQLRREASAPLEAFLLPEDDPRVVQTKALYVAQAAGRGEPSRMTSEWLRCETMHLQARVEEKLGSGRPFSAWQIGGGPPRMLDGVWQGWASCQAERVMDLLDINYLRWAAQGLDIRFKSGVWILSQNVDRCKGSGCIGVSPCLLPKMISFLLKGRPLIGLEALSLQAIPTEGLLLTRETETDLIDLAGNAMTTTVVGAAILAALIVGCKTIETSAVIDDSAKPTSPMVEAAVHSVETKIRGADRLTEIEVDISQTAKLQPTTLVKAGPGARMCLCEDGDKLTTRPISTCTACGYSACEACQARPDHQYEPYTGPRESPATFASEIKAMLPARLGLAGFNLASLARSTKTLRQAGVRLDEKLLHRLMKTLVDAVNEHEFCLADLKRGRDWVATYKAANASVELHFEPNRVEWRLFVKPDPFLWVNDDLRKLLHLPVARMILDPSASSLLDGEWDISLPTRIKSTGLEVMMENCGEEVPSWQASLGLEKYQKDKRSTRIKVSVPDATRALLDRDIEGVYELKPTCGTAQSSLYRRVTHHGSPVDPAQTPLFLFFDPDRAGDSSRDSFRFSHEIGPLEYGVFRPSVATVAPTWRPSIIKGAQLVRIFVRHKWSRLASARITTRDRDVATFAVPTGGFELSAATDGCTGTDNVLRASIQLSDKLHLPWTKPEWVELDVQRDGARAFAGLSWLLARVPAGTPLAQWMEMNCSELDGGCAGCNPPPPRIEWTQALKQGHKLVPVEDGQEAAAYERALKARPSSVSVLIKQPNDNFLHLSVGLNVATLAHRALGALPAVSAARAAATGPARVEWRLDSLEPGQAKLGKSMKPVTFTLPNNKHDEPALQPPHFTNDQAQLRPEQLRSLAWMIKQEVEPQPWVEEEVAESVIPQLGWHVKARASRKTTVKGGLVADWVGYGKTAITVGLISARLKDVKPPSLESLSEVPDRIPIKATLVLVPSHLCGQCQSIAPEVCLVNQTLTSLSTCRDRGAQQVHQLWAPAARDRQHARPQAAVHQEDQKGGCRRRLSVAVPLRPRLAVPRGLCSFARAAQDRPVGQQALPALGRARSRVPVRAGQDPDGSWWPPSCA